MGRCKRCERLGYAAYVISMPKEGAIIAGPYKGGIYIKLLATARLSDTKRRRKEIMGRKYGGTDEARMRQGCSIIAVPVGPVRVRQPTDYVHGYFAGLAAG